MDVHVGLDCQLPRRAHDREPRRHRARATCTNDRANLSARGCVVRKGAMTREAAREAARAKKAELKASGCKTCLGCKRFISLDEFSSRERQKRGKTVTVVEARCRPCFASYQSAKFQTPEFRAKNNATKASAEYKQWRKGYRQQDHVKEAETRYQTSEAGRQSLKKRKDKYYGSELWRQSQDRVNSARRERYAEDHLVRLNVCLSSVVGKMLKGNRKTSRTLYSFTEFADATDLANHLSLMLHGNMTMDNYGTVWHVEHRIAKCWYGNNEDDIRNCWSRANIAPEFGPDNLTKSIHIIDELCHQVGKERWPRSWNGQIPEESTKAKMYREMLVRAPVPTSRPVSVQEDAGADRLVVSDDEFWFE